MIPQLVELHVGIERPNAVLRAQNVQQAILAEAHAYIAAARSVVVMDEDGAARAAAFQQAASALEAAADRVGRELVEPYLEVANG